MPPPTRPSVDPADPAAPAAPAGTAAAGPTLFERVLADEPGVRSACLAQLHVAEACGDLHAAGLAATAALLHTLASFADFRGLTELLSAFDRFRAARSAGMLEPARADNLRADAVQLCLPDLDHQRLHDAPALHALRERLFDAVRSGTGMAADERVLMGKLLADHLGMRNDMAQLDRCIALVTGVVLEGQVGPPWQGRWWLLVAANAEYRGQLDMAQEALQLAQAVAQRCGLPEVAYGVARGEMTLALRAADLMRAQRAFQQLEQLRMHVRPALLPHGLRAQATLQLRRGEYEAALERTALVLDLCRDHEVPERDRAGYIEMKAIACTGLGRHAEAVATLQALRPTQDAGQRDVLEALIAMAAAVGALADADASASAARQQVAHAVRLCVAAKYSRFLMSHPGWAARVAAIALDDGVCIEFVAAAVRERVLAPPEPWREVWPWKLRVRVLGGLEVRRDEALLSGIAGKAQKRPLELLVLLAAHPAGLASAELIDTLWPSLDADAPKASLQMAIARLRKWLDLPEAVRVADGRVSLHPALVWTDVAGFEAAAAQGEVEVALRLYRGALLAGEPLQGLAAQARDRVAAQLVGLVLKAGAELHAAGRPAEARALYARGLAAEPGAGVLRRALAG
jgi:tetratricopeptide (TPR) repeat protein